MILQVKVQGDDILVKADKKSLADFRRAPIPCSLKAGEDTRAFVIVGGGECGLTVDGFGIS